MVLIELKSEQEFESYIRQNKVNYVMFTMDGCGPCQQMKQIITRDYQQFKILLINIKYIQKDLNTRLAIKGLPTFAKYMNGKRLGSFAGGDVARLRRMLQSSISSNGSDWNSESNQNSYYR